MHLRFCKVRLAFESGGDPPAAAAAAEPPEEEREPPPKAEHPCARCGRAFGTAGGLSRHKNRYLILDLHMMHAVLHYV